MSCSDSDDIGAIWRMQLLKGVESIPHTGGIPGGVVIWGENARGILCASSDEENGGNGPVIIGAGELGRGRIVCVSHSYIVGNFNGKEEDENLQMLHRNILNWLTRGQGSMSIIIVLNRTSKLKQLTKDSLLFWKGANYIGDIEPGNIIDLVKDGGAVLHASCPWGWLQTHAQKTLEEMPLFEVLEKVGIGYTGDYAKVPHTGLFTSCHTPSDNDHALFGFRKLLTQLGKPIEAMDDVPSLDLTKLPRKACEQIVKPHLCHITEVTKNADIGPTKERPVKSKSTKSIMKLVETVASLDEADMKLPGIDVFPGDFDSSPPLVCAKVCVQSVVHDIHPTGFYLPARVTLKVHVETTGDIPMDWAIRVGAHSDDIGSNEEIRRWPKITKTLAIKEKEMSIKSPFGGLIYLQSPKSPSKVTVSLQNVVEAPHFDLNNQESVKHWKQRRNAPGLWADIIGETIIITLPAKSVRKIDDPSEVMKTWDRVVRAHHHLRGTNPAQYRRQWVVADEQPVVGYMHAGYPIVTHLDVADPGSDKFLLDNDHLIRDGSWGMFHELGHNMQRNKWTFQGTTEVTCNIFTLHAMAVVANKEIWIIDWLQNQLKRVKVYLQDDKEGFATWQKSPGIALFVYAQVAHHFGWAVYKDIFRHYENMENDNKLANVEDKVDYWFVQLSHSCGYNLAPLFEFWKIPLRDTAMKCVSRLIPFLPDDDIIDMCSSHKENVLRSYECHVSRDPGSRRPDQFLECSTSDTMASATIVVDIKCT